MEKMDLFMLSSALLSNPLLHPKRQIPKQAYFPEKNGTLVWELLILSPFICIEPLLWNYKIFT